MSGLRVYRFRHAGTTSAVGAPRQPRGRERETCLSTEPRFHDTGWRLRIGNRTNGEKGQKRATIVKVLDPALAAILGAERFFQGIKIAANLQHTHVLSLHDSGGRWVPLLRDAPYVVEESLGQRAALDRGAPPKITPGGVARAQPVLLPRAQRDHPENELRLQWIVGHAKLPPSLPCQARLETRSRIIVGP